MTRRRLLILAGASTFAGLFLGVLALIALDVSLLNIPLPVDWKGRAGSQKTGGELAKDGSTEYKAVTERNLFRAKLQAEIPKPMSEKEIEEETLVNILRPMTLKGVMTGQQNKDFFAVIDRGGQKGVWTYEVGETIERGLAVTQIRKDAVIMEKGDFAAILKLFAKSFERIPSTNASTVPKETLKQEDLKLAKKTQPASHPEDFGKDVKKEGKTTVIPKSLAEKMRSDNTTIMSSLSVKPSTDTAGRPNGYKVVSVDSGSLAQKLGIRADDVLQEVNGYELKTAEDTKKAHDALKNVSKFEIKVLRQGKVETLSYEIR
ncbi:MAG TPA: type II secretion system protein N [Syntrophorhabdales bacterium]|nr:type II secretion system protein N [Syntrophorhabdales bacterium]